MCYKLIQEKKRTQKELSHTQFLSPKVFYDVLHWALPEKLRVRDGESLTHTEAKVTVKEEGLGEESLFQ